MTVLKSLSGTVWSKILALKSHHMDADHWKEREWENKMVDMEVIKWRFTFRMSVFSVIEDKTGTDKKECKL